ncbi:IS3 family transposase, partial [Ligilactobacillus equi]|uniref:IS3 family transposase n=1 Tax=Ligilactobacillus equi TaxID=137357 RepID=UPI002ED26E45
KRVGLSRSNYYAQKKRSVSAIKLKRQEIMSKIKEIWEKSKHIYGAPKITMILRKNGFRIAVKTVGNYMRNMGIKAHYVKPWTTTTRDSEYSDQLLNYLDEHFNHETPNARWCIDTTCIPIRNGFAYLTSIMDLYSRKIIAWDLSDNLEVANVVPLIERAKCLRGITQPLIMHSDRGSQFTSDAYKAVTADFKLSYSKKAYPWDNACIESFSRSNQARMA